MASIVWSMSPTWRSRDQIRAHHGEALGECLAIVAAEEEVDRRQHVLRGERVDDLARLRFVHLRRAALGASSGEAATCRLAAQLAAGVGEVAHLGPGVVDHQIELAVDEIVERQRHGPLGVGDEADRAVGAADPGRDLVGVGDRRREADELDVLRAEDDRLFPGRAALRIGQIVNLVEDDGVDVVEIPRRLQEHVAQDLGGHDDDAGIPVLGDIAGEESDLVAVDRAQIAIFLVRERLDRRGVDDAAGAA